MGKSANIKAPPAKVEVKASQPGQKTPEKNTGQKPPKKG